MGKKFKEKYLQMKIDGDEYVKIDGSALPYIVNRFGTIFGHGPSGVIHVQPMQEASTGFLKVTLFDGPVRHEDYLHMIVAQAYIPNPDSLTGVRFIDKNPMNCSVSNLEWYDPEEETEEITTQSKTPMNKSSLDDKAICVCFRAFQGKSNPDILKEFGKYYEIGDVKAVKEIINKHQAEFILQYRPDETKGTSYKAKLRFIRPFIKHTIRLMGADKIHDLTIADQIGMSDVDIVTVQRHVRYIRENKMEPEFYEKKKK